MSQKTAPPRRRSRRQQQVSGIQIVFASILAIGLLLTINFSGRIRRGQQIEDLRSQIEATIHVLSTEQANLIAERDRVSNDAFVIDWAHRNGKLVRENEILVIPWPGGIMPTATPIPTPVPVATPTEIPTRNLWWNLFFDDDPPF